MPVCSTRFADVEYLDDGPPEGTPVVLVHGFPDVPETWDEVMSFLPAGVRVIRPFLRGVGGTCVTDPAARSGQVAALATDLLDLIRALDIGPVVLVGHDWGARAAHAVAALAPETVRGLVTLATAYGPSTLLAGPDVLDEAAAAWYRYWLCTEVGSAAFREDPRQLVELAWKNWSPALPLPREALGRILRAVDTEDFADLVVHYYRHGAGEAPGSPAYSRTQAVLDDWPVIAAPATFLIGTGDGCETLSLARANSGFFASGRELVELDGVGHFIPREEPRAVADAIARYL